MKKQYFKFQYASLVGAVGKKGENSERATHAVTDEKIEVGDTLLLTAQNGIGTIGVVTEMLTADDYEFQKRDNESKFIAVITDSCDHLKKYKKEVQNKDKKDQMDKMIKELDEQAKLRAYADISPEFRKLYEEVYGKID